MSVRVTTVESRQGNGDEARLTTTMKFEVADLVKCLHDAHCYCHIARAPAIHKLAGSYWAFG